jgi:hypothetical protein
MQGWVGDVLLKTWLVNTIMSRSSARPLLEVLEGSMKDKVVDSYLKVGTGGRVQRGRSRSPGCVTCEIGSV